jgi:DNA end-binding protein Ku
MPRRERKRQSRRRPTGAAEKGAASALARGVWSGSLSFGLVTIPIELYSAQRRDLPGLRMLSPDGNPLQRRYVCPEEDRPLEPDEIVRGYPVARDEFVVVSDEELEALAPRRSRDIQISRFVVRDSIDPALFQRAYYLLPAGEQTKAYAVLADAMEQSERAAIAHFVMHDRAHAVAVFADAGLLRAEILRFTAELRSARDVGLRPLPKADGRRVRRMREAIRAKARPRLDGSELRDPESERIAALARGKLERGEDVVDLPDETAAVAEASDGGEVVDLIALLKRQLGPGSGRRPPRKAPARAARPRRRHSR